MKRREFLGWFGKGVLAFGTVALGVNFTGCSPKKINVKGVEYQISEGVISQATKGDRKIKLGVMCDLHAHRENTQYLVNQLEKRKVDAYFLAGDLSCSFGDYEGAKDDYNEILDVARPVAETGKLVLTIPGNHEQRRTYTRALDDLASKYPNVVDMQRNPVADLDDLTIIALGGNDNPRFNVPEGFLLTENDFVKLGNLARQYQKDRPLLVATHVPQKYDTQTGLDVIDGRMNVGSQFLRSVRKSIGSKFAISGHIHESSGMINDNEEKVQHGEFYDSLDFNPGAVYDHLERKTCMPSAGILEFQNGKARAEIVMKWA